MNHRLFPVAFLAFALAMGVTLCSAAPLGEVAIFTDQSGWIAVNSAQAQGVILADSLKRPKDVVTLSDNDIGTWAEEHTDNNQVDIIVTFGWFPTSLYTPGNADPDGSVAELFLEGGNVFINSADYIFYVTQGGGVNGDAALKNMMDINADMWGGGNAMEPTADGEKYTPSLEGFTSERPFKSEQIVDPWEVEVMFAEDGKAWFDPGFVHDTETDGRIGICMQEPNNPNLPRGNVITEMIDNYLFEILGGLAVDPESKLPATWAQIKMN